MLRYLWLRMRGWLPGLRPTQASWDRAHGKTGRVIYRLANVLSHRLAPGERLIAAAMARRLLPRVLAAR